MIWLELQASLCSASSCLSHIDLGTENGAGHATIMTTATDDLGSDFVFKIFSQYAQIFSNERNKTIIRVAKRRLVNLYKNSHLVLGVWVNFITQELKFLQIAQLSGLYFCVSFSSERKYERIERNLKHKIRT